LSSGLDVVSKCLGQHAIATVQATVIETSTGDPVDQFDDLMQSFVRLSNLPTYPLDRVSHYEAMLWRQACQILLTLQCLDR
jgi:hypothetical protein